MESGISALPVALALRLPGDYLPLRGLRGINLYGELAVVEQAQRAEQPTADRDNPFFLHAYISKVFSVISLFFSMCNSVGLLRTIYMTGLWLIVFVL